MSPAAAEILARAYSERWSGDRLASALALAGVLESSRQVPAPSSR